MILKARHGQSLMELLIGMAVGVIFIVGAASIIIPSLEVNKQAGSKQAQGQIAQDMATDIRAWAANNWNSVLALATGTANGYYLNTTISPFTPVSAVNNTATVIFTSNGTWTKPANLISATVQVIGAGGAGGGDYNGSAGGGGGSSAFGTYVIAPGGGGGGSWSGCAGGAGGSATSGGQGGNGDCGGTPGAGGGGGAYAATTFLAANLPASVSVYVGQGATGGVGGSGYYNGGTATSNGGGGGGGATGAGAANAGNGTAAGGTGGAVGSSTIAGATGSISAGSGGAAGGSIGGAGGTGGATGGTGGFPGGGGGGASGGGASNGGNGEVIVTETLNPTSLPTGQPVTICPPGVNSYEYSRAITVNASQVSSTLSNFPMLISGTYPYLATVSNGGNVQNANGYDIVFASDAAGQNILPFEQENYSSSTGAINYWVQVPTMSSAATTTIYMLYDNAAITTSQANATSVWSNGYAGVWHFPNGTTLSANDSTANGNNGTISGATAASGDIDGGASFNGSSYIDIGNASSVELQTMTLSAWIDPTNNNATRGIFGGSGSGDGYYEFRDNSSNRLELLAQGIASLGTSVGTVTAGTWTYAAVTYNSSGAYTFYINGVAAGSGTNARTFSYGSDHEMIGKGYSNQEYFNGLMDEARAANVVRSPGWILTEYNNQSSPSTFYTVSGATASSVSLPISSNCSVYNRYFYLSDIYRDASGNATTTASGNFYDPSTKLATIVITQASSTAAPSYYSFYIARGGNNAFSQGTWLGGAQGASSTNTFVSSTYGASNKVTVNLSGALQLSTANGAGGSCFTTENSSQLLDWPINEGSGITVYDTAGNGYNTTWMGLPSNGGSYYASGTVGTYAGYFDGYDDYLQVPSAMAGSISGSFTLSGWINMSSCNTWSRILGFGNGPSASNVTFAATNGTSCRPDLDLRNGGTVIVSLETPSAVPLNTWTLVTAVVSSTNATLYINGSAVANATLSAALTTATRNYSYIGRSDWSSDGWYAGSIDDVRIYNTALSDANVASIYAGSPPSSGLVAEYNFENNSNDSSGNGNNATWGGTPVYNGLYYASGTLYTYAGLFNGVNNYLQTPNLTTINSPAVPFTINFWFNPSAQGDLVTESGGGINTGWHDSWIEVLSSGQMKFRVWNCAALSPGTVSMNSWNMATLMYDGSSTLKAFLNGAAASSTETCTRANPGGSGYGEYFNLGAVDGTNMGSGQWYSGKIGPFAVFARTLSNDEINTLYSGGTVQ